MKTGDLCIASRIQEQDCQDGMDQKDGISGIGLLQGFNSNTIEPEKLVIKDKQCESFSLEVFDPIRFATYLLIEISI